MSVTLTLICWSMVANTTGAPPAPPWVLWSALALNVVTVLLLLFRHRPPRFAVVVAAVLGLAVALPLTSVVVHGTWNPDPPVMGAVAGSAAMVAVLASPVWGADRVLRTTVLLGTGFVWLNLLLGLGSLMDSPVDVAYHRNERDWIGLWQLKGLAGHPNALAMICALVLLLQIVALVESGRGMSRGRGLAAWLLGPGATLVAILWTQSRTGWMAAALGLGALAVPWRRVGRGAAPAMAGLWVVLIVAPPVLATLRHVTFNGRDLAWEQAERLIAMDPTTGWGALAFSPDFWAVAVAHGHEGWKPMHAHHVLLQAGVLLGVPGLLIVAAAWCLACAVALRARAESGLAMAAVTSMAVYAGVEPAFGTGSGGAVYLPVLLLALILGWTGALSPRPSRDQPATEPPQTEPATRELGRQRADA